MSAIKLIDPYQRRLNYLRISITDRCNLRCVYCVPHDRLPKLPHDDILSYEEILRFVRLAVPLGINKVRVTGGEPLVRRGVYPFLNQLSQIDGLEDISLTTNAVLMEQNAEKIKASGISRINVSLDSLDKKKFQYITGYDLFDQVWRGIEKAHDLGFNPIKINVVALKGINEDEFLNFGKLSVRHPFHIRFIEYMPIGKSEINSKNHILTPEIKNILSKLGPLQAINNDPYDGPAERYRYEGAKGEVGFISALSKHFCHRCNRLRLTAKGYLRACLLSDREEDIKSLLRSDESDKAIVRAIKKAIKHKGSQHSLSIKNKKTIADQMSGIGG